jgi:EsV-1-7 cysteine-rich motif
MDSTVKRSLSDDSQSGGRPSKKAANSCKFPGCLKSASRSWCDEHKSYRTCRAVDCTKHCSYNVAGAGAQWCKVHKAEGMINVVARRCVCGKSQPAFGFPGDEFATRCASCKDEGMIDIKNRICVCKNAQPSFGFPGDKRATCCASCKTEGMINIVSRRCVCGNAIPCFGFPDDDRATFCASCKTEGTIDIVSRRCVCGCAQPNFGFPGDDRATCCSNCKQDGMIDIVHRRCICLNARPSFGFPGDERATFCANCKQEGMINIVSLRCVCGNSQPSFGFKVDERATCCANCKQEGMLDIVSRRCICGNSTSPIFGFMGEERATCCASCKAEGMIDIIHLRCVCDSAQPSFGVPGDERATCCVYCKAEGMIDIKTRRCIHGRDWRLCRGEVCHINNIGKRSYEEMFPSATAFIIWSGGDDLDAFLHAIQHRLTFGSTTMHPDLLVDKRVFEYDGRRWHCEKTDNDRIKTAALVDAGYTVVRARDCLDQVPRATNVEVDARCGVQSVSREVARTLGMIDERGWPNLWHSAESLAHRAILSLSQRYVQNKQTTIDDWLM